MDGSQIEFPFRMSALRTSVKDHLEFPRPLPDSSEPCPWRRWQVWMNVCYGQVVPPALQLRSARTPAAGCQLRWGAPGSCWCAGSESDGCEVYSETAYVLGSLPTLPNP